MLSDLPQTESLELNSQDRISSDRIPSTEVTPTEFTLGMTQISGQFSTRSYVLAFVCVSVW